MVKAGDGSGVESLEAPAFGRGEVVGEREGGEVIEAAADALEPALELGRAGGDGRGRRLWAQAAERVAQEQASVGLVAGAKELDEHQRLPRGQAMALGAVEDAVLVLVSQRTQGPRQGRPHGALGERALGGGRQRAEGQAGFDPARLVSQQARDPARGQSVLLGEGLDDFRLVEGRHGARRGVGQQQPPLLLHRRRGAFDHRGHEARALLAPALQPLEAVEDLEEAVIGGSHAQRQLGQRLRRDRALAGAQLGEPGAQPVGGKRPHGVERLWSGHDAPVTAPWRGRRRQAGG